MLFRRLLFDHITACCLYCRLGAKKLAEYDISGCYINEKNRRIAIDEELLITGVSVSEENQRVLNGSVSASVTNSLGIPNLVKMSVNKNFITASSVALWSALASTHLVI
jgi:hypothetical protein